MNAQVSNFYSLPTALFPQSIPHPARRHLIDDFQPDEGAVERFNQLLARFQHAPLDLDQIATAARKLPWPKADGRAPGCIEQQLKRATSIGLMIDRSEEHTSELQSLMRISYAVFCLKKNNDNPTHHIQHTHHNCNSSHYCYECIKLLRLL